MCKIKSHQPTWGSNSDRRNWRRTSYHWTTNLSCCARLRLSSISWVGNALITLHEYPVFGGIHLKKSLLGRTEICTRERKDRQLIQTVWDIFRDDQATWCFNKIMSIGHARCTTSGPTGPLTDHTELRLVRLLAALRLYLAQKTTFVSHLNKMSRMSYIHDMKQEIFCFNMVHVSWRFINSRQSHSKSNIGDGQKCRKYKLRKRRFKPGGDQY